MKRRSYRGSQFRIARSVSVWVRIGVERCCALNYGGNSHKCQHALANSFVRCMTAISAVIFVVSGRWNLITVAILGFVENSDFSQAAALSMILIAFVMAALGLIQLVLTSVFKRRITEFFRDAETSGN